MQKLSEILQESINEGVIHGAVCGVVTIDKVNDPIAVGVANAGLESSFPMIPEAIFDVASVTKTVPVSTLALMALDREMVTLDTPLIELLPEYNSPQRETILFRHLLTQTLDFDFAMSSLKDTSAEEIWDFILQAPLKRPAGSHYFYCNTTSLLLGRVVENLFGNRLDRVAQKELFSPLGMDKTRFRPELNNRMVATEEDDWRGRAIRGEIHDESSWKLNHMMIPGAAGLFTTVSDLQKYIASILDGGKGLFSEVFLNQCIDNYTPHLVDQKAALGFEFDQPYMGETRSTRTIGKTGFTGSVIVIDYERKLGFSLLTDFTWPKRKPSKDAIVLLRQRIADAIWGGATA